jgi:hypothetical protein
MAKPEEKPGTPGVSRVVIDSKQCVKCGEGDLVVHTHAHKHGDKVHEHPHAHPIGQGHAEGDDAVHEHEH